MATPFSRAIAASVTGRRLIATLDHLAVDG
jgi:hypothetical protein